MMCVINGNEYANEAAAMSMCDNDAQADRELFVHNLGELLHQTREGITGAHLDEHEIVHVKYRGGHEELINVKCDSYLAIIRDVTKGL